jgi:hypothetical protein
VEERLKIIPIMQKSKSITLGILFAELPGGFLGTQVFLHLSCHVFLNIDEDIV